MECSRGAHGKLQQGLTPAGQVEKLHDKLDWRVAKQLAATQQVKNSTTFTVEWELK
jgi:hypothetical protein